MIEMISMLLLLLLLSTQSFADRGITLAVTKSDQSTESIFLGNYYALVIGNNHYRALPNLNTAINDANKLASLLKAKYSFSVKTIIDGTRQDILQALSEYRKQLTKNDNLLIYYAGHGILDEKEDEGYWLPVDSSPSDDVNWISNNKIVNTLKALDAKHVLVIADSCFSGKLARDVHVNPRDNNYLQRIAKKRARTVLTSGGLEPVADGDGENSPFARALIKVLSENKSALEGSALFTKIRRQVVLDEDQTPEYADIRKAGHEGGDFIFAVNSGASLKLTLNHSDIIADNRSQPSLTTHKSTVAQDNSLASKVQLTERKPWYKQWYPWVVGAVVAGFVLSRCTFGEGATEDKAGQGVSCN